MNKIFLWNIVSTVHAKSSVLCDLIMTQFISPPLLLEWMTLVFWDCITTLIYTFCIVVPCVDKLWFSVQLVQAFSLISFTLIFIPLFLHLKPTYELGTFHPARVAQWIIFLASVLWWPLVFCPVIWHIISCSLIYDKT